MVIKENNESFLNFIEFKDLSKWYVSYYINPYSIESKYNLIELGELIKPVKNKIRKLEYKGDFPIVSKISFSDGKIHLRDENKTGMDLYKLSPKQLLVSKINFHQGAVSINYIGELACSTHYQPYKIDTGKVNSDYLILCLRSKPFLNFISYLRAEGIKNEATYEFIKELKIPYPDISEQLKIVDDHNQLLQFISNSKTKNQNSKIALKKFWLSQTNIPLFKERPISYGFHLTELKAIKRWGTEFILGGQENYEPKYEEKRIDEICQVGSGGTPSRKRLDYYEDGNILWVKTTEVRNKIISDTKEKITDEALKNSSAKLYPAGSLLIAMYGQGLTRGRTAKLAVPASTNQACAVLHDIDNDVILTDYLWYYLQNEYFRLRQLASGNNQPNLNADMIKSYKIQIPPIEKQREIIKHIAEIRKETKRLNKEAEESEKLAIEEFEKELFQEA